MDGSGEGSLDIVLSEHPTALRPYVFQGDILDETPEGQIRQLRRILEVLAEAATAPDSLHDLLAGLGRKPLMGRFGASIEYDLMDQASALLRKELPYCEDDLRAMLETLVNGGIRTSIYLPLLSQLTRHIARLAQSQGLPDALRPRLECERDRLRPFPGANQYGRLLIRVERLLEPDDAGLPDPREAWAAAMRSFLSSLAAGRSAQWRALLAHAAAVEQTRPSAKWLHTARLHLEAVGVTAFRTQALAWLGAAAEPFDRTLSERNGVVLKGLAWTCSVDDDPETARTLAKLAAALLKWLPARLDWRGLKAGNACLNALAMMPGPEPLAQLARLSQRLKGRQLQTSVNRAVEVATQRRGLPRADLEELTVPTHAVDADGCLHAEIGGVRVLLAPTAAAGVEWHWFVHGDDLPTAPATIRDAHADELSALRATAKEIGLTVSAQRARLERLYFDDRRWRLSDWRARYLAHPLLQPIARALIWQLETARGDTLLAIPGSEGLEDVDGLLLRDLPDDTLVRLWHPLGSEAALVASWRRRLSELGLLQPFQQVERETYALTAEEWAAAASARFAGHVLRQQQLSALCRERGWQYALQGPWRGDAPHAVRPLPQWCARAELRVDVVGGREAGETRTGAYPYVCSDAVRFRASDGGPYLLTEIPERVISEVLRDVDLFVSAAAARPVSRSRGPAAAAASDPPGAAHGASTRSSRRSSRR